MDAYEELRGSATGASTPAGGLRGLGILVQRGMAAWIHALTVAAAVSPAPAYCRVVSCHEPLPAGVQHEVVDVLATMALAASEVRT